jgi:hypothetical protein
MQKPKPIAFKTKNEFQERPNYQANLSCDATELDYIVGKYHFGKEHEFQCGLNHCNQWHQIGFVIATKSGTETHCGQKCGANSFGVTWDEVEADFKKQEEAMNRLASLQSIQDEANTTLKRCAELSTKCEPLAIKIQRISQEISTESAFKRALDETIKLGGQIFGKAEQSEFMSDGANETVVIATIDGGEAVSTSASIMRTLKYQVQRPLNELLSKDLQALTDKEIKTELATLKNYTATLTHAEAYIGQATRFTAANNLKKIELLIDQLPKNSRNHRVRRIATKICTIV